MTDSPVTLPTELNYLVLEYAGKVRIRNGKYMNQIPKDDPRYDILKRLPLKKGSYNMIHNQSCWIVDVFTHDNEILAQYMERFHTSNSADF